MDSDEGEGEVGQETDYDSEASDHFLSELSGEEAEQEFDDWSEAEERIAWDELSESAEAKKDDFYPLPRLPRAGKELSDRAQKAADKRKQFEKVVGLFENVGKTQYPNHSHMQGAKKLNKPSEREDNILDLVKTFDCDLLNVVTRKHGSLLNLAAKHNAPRLCDYLLTERGAEFFEFSARDEHGRTGRTETEVHRMNWLDDGSPLPSVASLRVLLKSEKLRHLWHAKSSTEGAASPLVDLFEAAASAYLSELNRDLRATVCNRDCGSFPWAQLASGAALAAIHIWFDVAASRNVLTPLPVAVEAYGKLGGHLIDIGVQRPGPPYAHRTGWSVVGAWGFRVLSQLLHSVKSTEGRDFVRAVAGPSAKLGCAGDSHAKICNDYLQVHYSTALLCLNKTALPPEIVTKVKTYLGFANEHSLRDERELLALEKQKMEKATLSAAEKESYVRLTRTLCLDSKEQMDKKRELIKLLFAMKPRNWWDSNDDPLPDRALALAGELFGLDAAQAAGEGLGGRACQYEYVSWYNKLRGPKAAKGLPGILLRDVNTIKEAHRFSLDSDNLWFSTKEETETEEEERQNLDCAGL